MRRERRAGGSLLITVAQANGLAAMLSNPVAGVNCRRVLPAAASSRDWPSPAPRRRVSMGGTA